MPSAQKAASPARRKGSVGHHPSASLVDDGRVGWYPVAYPYGGAPFPCGGVGKPFGGDWRAGKPRGHPRGRAPREEFEKPASLLKAEEASRKLGAAGTPGLLNSHGFPLRSGKPDCKHYMTKSWCAYGAMCKFNHPEQGPPAGFGVPSGYPGDQGPLMVAPGPWGRVAPPYYWAPWGGVLAAAPGFVMGASPTYFHPEFMFSQDRSSSVDSALSSLLDVRQGDSDKGSDAGVNLADYRK